MAGRFDGLSDLEWKLFEDLFSEPEKRGKGMPHVPFRYVINTLLYILITGCRWCDIPRGEQWASKSSAHRWLTRWTQDGTLTLLQQRVLNLAQEKGLIHWEYGAPWTALFPPGKGGGEAVSHGGKGKGILIHLLTEGNGMPLSACTTAANEDDRKQVLPLIDQLKVKTAQKGRPRKRVKVLAGDKGYDAKWLRHSLRKRGIRGQIAKRRYKGKKRKGRPIKISVPRFQQERCFAWLQRKYRRLVVRWERLKSCFDGFIYLAIVHIWVNRILLVG